MIGWVPADGDYAKSATPGWRDRDWSRHEYDATVAGRRLHYLDVGTGERVFILVHGMGGRWQHWLENVPWLAEHGRPETLDELTRHAISAWLAELAETCQPSTVATRLRGAGRAVALTFDACGGPHSSGYDAALIALLRREQVRATLFLNTRWVEANPRGFADLAADPLFHIGDHGNRHLPLSVTGRSAYGIRGTRNVGEVYDEVHDSAVRLAALARLTGALPPAWSAALLSGAPGKEPLD